ncbi:unnamed protein product [Brassicogethes aeneus]|uniref:Protein hook n=1 Tax=Brassicogethes aeneus TaxID=1431903 RepID=A0A9P0BFL9_BRAAE|nr:unnamed protein product [Brassicogethes aeneus]
MDPNDEMCKSLLKWLQEIVPNRTRNVAEICDGVAIVEALMQISAEDFSKLEGKIKKDVGTNWRLRVSNLKKIVEAIMEYYQDVLSLQLLEVGRPDVNKIGEFNDQVQLGKLLRLLLGCAINCYKKQEYITKIMEMEELVQRNIMTAIQQLEEISVGPGRSGLSMLILDSDPLKVAKLSAELEAVNEAKDVLSQQLHQLEQQIQSLSEEKEHLLMMNKSFSEKEIRGADARKQIEYYKEELLKAEVLNDDLKAKIGEQEKQMVVFQEKIAELQVAANDSSRLKDEVDALNESAGKIADLELAVQSYQKRLENYQDIKRNVQKLEEKNTEYLQRNLELEEELNKSNGWRSQCDAYKSELAELQQKFDEELQKSEKLQFTHDSIKSKLKALQGEKERLILERDVLREENEELKLGTIKKESSAAVSQELTPTEMREKLRFLEKENKNLRNQSQDGEAKQAQLDSALSRIERLQQQNRQLNQSVLKFEAQLEEIKGGANGPPPTTAAAADQSAATGPAIVKEYKQKVALLQDSLNAKDNELQMLQAKHNRYVEKAKSIVQQHDSIRLEGGAFKEQEGKLISTAFYNLALTCQREAIDERLAVLSAAGQGQSFLARQRQATPRKNIQRYKSK